MTMIGATITTISVESLELVSVTMLVGVADANIDRESVTAVVVVVGTLVAVVPVAVTWGVLATTVVLTATIVVAVTLVVVAAVAVVLVVVPEGITKWKYWHYTVNNI